MWYGKITNIHYFHSLVTIPNIGVRSKFQHHSQATHVLLRFLADSQVYRSDPFTAQQVGTSTLWKKQLHGSAEEERSVTIWCVLHRGIHPGSAALLQTSAWWRFIKCYWQRCCNTDASFGNEWCVPIRYHISKVYSVMIVKLNNKRSSTHDLHTSVFQRV